MVTSAYILQKDAHALALIKKVMIMILGGRRGIAVFITAYGAKGRGFEHQLFLFFFESREFEFSGKNILIIFYLRRTYDSCRLNYSPLESIRLPLDVR